MKVVKRDGTIVDYDADKIRIAIQKANNEVPKKEKCTKENIEEIIKYIEDLGKSRMLVEDIQDIIEEQLNKEIILLVLLVLILLDVSYYQKISYKLMMMELFTSMMQTILHKTHYTIAI